MVEAAAQLKAVRAEEQRAADSRAEAQAALDAALAVEKAVRDKERRVEHLSQMATRRLSRQGVSRGFTAWAEEWEEGQRRRRLLSVAGARLIRPQVRGQRYEVRGMRSEARGTWPEV